MLYNNHYQHYCPMSRIYREKCCSRFTLVGGAMFVPAASAVRPADPWIATAGASSARFGSPHVVTSKAGFLITRVANIKSTRASVAPSSSQLMRHTCVERTYQVHAAERPKTAATSCWQRRKGFHDLIICTFAEPSYSQSWSTTYTWELLQTITLARASATFAYSCSSPKAMECQRLM